MFSLVLPKSNFFQQSIFIIFFNLITKFEYTFLFLSNAKQQILFLQASLALHVLSGLEHVMFLYTYLTGKFTMVGFFSTKNVFFVNLCEKKKKSS